MVTKLECSPSCCEVEVNGRCRQIAWDELINDGEAKLIPRKLRCASEEVYLHRLVEFGFKCSLVRVAGREKYKIVQVKSQTERKIVGNRISAEQSRYMGARKNTNVGEGGWHLLMPVARCPTETMQGFPKEPQFARKEAARRKTDHNVFSRWKCSLTECIFTSPCLGL